MIPLLSVLLICISSVSSYQTLTLPSDFDLSHPALNYAAHDELLQTNPNAVLPQLPSEILALARTVEEDEASTQVDTVNCETYSGSPKREDGIYAGNRLESIPYPFVCHVFPGTYTVIWTGGAEKVRLSGTRGNCVSYSYAGSSVREIATSCTRSIGGQLLAGGKKSIAYPISLELQLYR